LASLAGELVFELVKILSAVAILAGNLLNGLIGAMGGFQDHGQFPKQ
jgi:hypothetical protein